MQTKSKYEKNYRNHRVGSGWVGTKFVHRLLRCYKARYVGCYTRLSSASFLALHSATRWASSLRFFSQ